MIGAGIPFGAEQRLLPEWIPLSFFSFAIICMPLGWLLVALQADSIKSFSGGFGPVLGAIHMFTLGVLLSTAFGASMQMLPVATAAIMNKPRRVIILLGLIITGTTITLGGFSHYFAGVSAVGTVLLCLGALLYVVLIIRLLLRADGLHLVRRHAYSAAFFLFIAATLGLLMVLNWGEFLQFEIPNLGVYHAGLALYGFMGLLVFGFSRIMVPMLSISDKLNDKQALITLSLSICALLLWVLGSFIPATALGIIAALLHVYEMLTILKARLRSRLGPEWLAIRFGWFMLPISLVLILISLLSDNIANTMQAGVFIAITGWLVSFVIGILQRIVPFLLSMQIARRTGMPELPSKLCAENILNKVGPLHICAVLLCTIGIITDYSIFIRLGGLLGIISGGLFLTFFINALKRKRLSLEKQIS